MQVTAQLPSLASLIPFLESSNNQEYLVKRLRDLAATGAISKFKRVFLLFFVHIIFRVVKKQACGQIVSVMG